MERSCWKCWLQTEEIRRTDTDALTTPKATPWFSLNLTTWRWHNLQGCFSRCVSWPSVDPEFVICLDFESWFALISRVAVLGVHTHYYFSASQPVWNEESTQTLTLTLSFNDSRHADTTRHEGSREAENRKYGIDWIALQKRRVWCEWVEKRELIWHFLSLRKER